MRTKVKEYATENKIGFDAEKVSQKIKTLVKLSKTGQ